MTNFQVNFEHPWFLLLLIPAIALPLISYFRLGKRYRFTRNRITSIVLHITVMVLSIAVLAGLTFSYFLPNTDNEVILLVDSSYSNAEDSQEKTDNFIKEVIASTRSKFKLGIVTFGYDQVYASELSNDTSKTYSNYLQAPDPNTTATDIESALTYTASLFEKPKTARIVLLSDAVETDGTVANVIKSIASKGIHVDTVYFPNKEIEREIQIIGISTPEDKILVGERFNIELTVESSYESKATITPTDNAISGNAVEFELVEGTNKLTIPYMFTLPGLHEMAFDLETEYGGDTISFNNVYRSFFYLEIFDDILIIEGFDGESENLTAMLKDELNVTVVTVDDTVNMPDSLEKLRLYDEVILLNVANKDLPAGFDEHLYTYVHDIGGGLFTVAGNKPGTDPSAGGDSANAYTREDMYDSIYQKMLPVEVIEYTPPLAVMILVDVSKSMFTPGAQGYEGSNLQAAIQGARSCVDSLSERDYIGIMTLAETYDERIKVTPRTQRPIIDAAIDDIEHGALNDTLGPGNNTIFSTALERAGIALEAITAVEKRHIIIVTDGQPTEEDSRYTTWLEANRDKGITTSIVGINCDERIEKHMQEILVEYAGVTKENFHNASLEDVASTMRQDLMVPAIKNVNYEPFYPIVKDSDSIVMKDLIPSQLPILNGFYGVKLQEGADVILSSTFTPIYAEWDFGEGRVGTFACDLNGTWSSELVSSAEGATLINNIIISLFPSKSVKVPDIDAEVTGDNYSTLLSVFTTLENGEYIEVTVTSPSAEVGADPTVQTIVAGQNDSYSRIPFSVTTSGLHEIKVQKKDADGNLISESTFYKALSYSKEYDAFADQAAAEELAASLSKHSDGVVITDAQDVFRNAVKYLHIIIDPKIVFMIIAVVLFLLDIAARKFKWKWPHEIIRDRKKTKSMKTK